MDFLTVIMLVVLAVLIFFMFRNSRKRQRDAQSLQEKVVPGANIMTNFGMYGTILSIDTDKNEVLLETTPGTVLKVHRQTVARVIEAEVPEEEIVEERATPELNVDHAITTDKPAYGERLDKSTDTSDKKNDE